MFNGKTWADSTLVNVQCNFDNIQVTIEENSQLYRFDCKGYIALHWSGIWDEFIVEEISSTNNDPLIQETISKIEKRSSKANLYKLDTGNIHRNERAWQLITVKLIDGCELRVICNCAELSIAEK